MEDSIFRFCRTLSSICHHIQSASDALRESVNRRPIPLDSASSTFIQCLNRRVLSVGPDLNLLESMVLGTVSFEELLGHCNEVYMKNHTDLAQLEDRLCSFGYVPVAAMDDEDGVSDFATPVGMDMKLLTPGDGLRELSQPCQSVSAAGSIRKRLEEDPLFGDSICLQDLGLSDVCLATLASEGNDEISSPMLSAQNSAIYNNSKPYAKKIGNEPLAEAVTADQICNLSSSSGQFSDVLNSTGSVNNTVVKISKDDYDGLPSYMKSLASWEDLQEFVAKMNSLKQKTPFGESSFNQDEISLLGFGPKGRSYLLMLLRMNRVAVETDGGSISYRVLHDV